MRRFIIIMVPLGMLALAGGAARAGDDLQTLRERFKQRFDELSKLKSAGRIGETWQGYVEAVRPEDRDATAGLVNAENADRRALYRLLAEEEGLTPEEIARNNAVRNFNKAKKGEYLKGPEGQWKQK
jgi:uncharacterized protein